MNGTQLLSRRRVLAVVQLMLFVFSVSTSARPCMHGGNAHSAVLHEMSSHDMASMPTTDMPMPKNPTPSHAPSTPVHTDDCPWVVGCAGIAQFAVDAELRSIEVALPTASPVGVMLREITTDRDIESPPPRA